MSCSELEAITGPSSGGETSLHSLIAASSLSPLVEVKLDQLACGGELVSCDIEKFLEKHGLRLVSSDSWKEHQKCVPFSVFNHLDEDKSNHATIESEVQQQSQLIKLRVEILKSQRTILNLKREVSCLRYSVEELKQKHSSALSQVANLEKRVQEGGRREDHFQELLNKQQQLQAENETKSDLVVNEMTNTKGELEKVRALLEQEKKANIGILEQKEVLEKEKDLLVTLWNEESAKAKHERNRFMAFLVNVAGGLKFNIPAQIDGHISDELLAGISQQLHNVLSDLNENQQIMTKLEEIIMSKRNGKTHRVDSSHMHNDNYPLNVPPTAQESLPLGSMLTSNSNWTEHDASNGNECPSEIPVSSSYQNATTSDSVAAEYGFPDAGTKLSISIPEANLNTGNSGEELAEGDTTILTVDQPREGSGMTEMILDLTDTDEIITERSFPCTSPLPEQPMLMRTFLMSASSQSMLLQDLQDSSDNNITELAIEQYQKELSLHQDYFKGKRTIRLRKYFKDDAWCCQCCSEQFRSRREFSLHINNFPQWWKSKWEKSNNGFFSCASVKNCLYQTDNVTQSPSPYKIECKECRSFLKKTKELFAHMKQVHNMDDVKIEVLQGQPNLSGNVPPRTTNSSEKLESMSLPSISSHTGLTCDEISLDQALTMPLVADHKSSVKISGRRGRPRKENIGQKRKNVGQRGQNIGQGQISVDQSEPLRKSKRRDDKSEETGRYSDVTGKCTYVCKCGDKYQSETALLHHIRLKKYGKIFRCPRCRECKDQYDKIENHMKSRHPRFRQLNKIFICGLCTTRKPKEFESRNELRKHCTNEHPRKLKTQHRVL